MKDTLELLKEHLKYVCWMGHDEEQEQVLRAAVKEIKELRKTQVATDDGLTAAYMLARKEADDEIKALRAENERLREALRETERGLSIALSWSDGDGTWVAYENVVKARNVARAALGEEK